LINKKKIVIVSSGQPCGNPRMVKEAITLKNLFFEVSVIYCPMSTWGDEFDKKIFDENPEIVWKTVGAHPIKNRTIYFFTRLRRKFWESIYAFIGDVCNASIKSSVLYSQELGKEAMKHKADLYIGHNLGSIDAITKAARMHNAKCSFDFEDFHRGEEPKETLHWYRTKLIEDKYVVKLDAATAASPLISNAYQKYYPKLPFKTILNVFPFYYNKDFISSRTDRLKLFWFSQTVGKGRGLENLIMASARVIPQPSITLLGNCSLDIQIEFNSLAKEEGFDLRLLYFKSVMPEASLISEASQHHIGICSEDKSTMNRDLCLTNKIFTFMLGKNALLLSKTKAQIKFHKENNGIGMLYDLNDVNEITECLQTYQDKRELLNVHRSNSFRKAKDQFNWENESEKLSSYYKDLLEL
jgi:hypothetical protein